MSRRRDERGSITVWLALSSFVMIFLVGLAVDLGGQCLDPLDPTRRAHHAVAGAGQLTGRRGADAAAGTGDDGDGTGGARVRLDHAPIVAPARTPGATPVGGGGALRRWAARAKMVR